MARDDEKPREAEEYSLKPMNWKGSLITLVAAVAMKSSSFFFS